MMRTTPVVALAAATIPLFGLASGGVYLAIDVTINAVRSYRHHFTLTFCNYQLSVISKQLSV